MAFSSAIKKYCMLLGAVLSISTGISYANDFVLPTSNILTQQLNSVEKSTSTNKQELINHLQTTQSLLSKIEQQKIQNKNLADKIAQAPDTIEQVNQKIALLTNNSAQKPYDENWDLDTLTQQLDAKMLAMQSIQTEYNKINEEVITQKNIPQTSQSALSSNFARIQELNKLLVDSSTSSALQTQYNTEIAYLNLNDEYNQLLLKGNLQLATLAKQRLTEIELEQSQIQATIIALNNRINDVRLLQSTKQLEQSQSQQKSGGNNPIIQAQLALNTSLSQELLTQTQKNNELTEAELKVDSALNNLVKTQHNIEEQISSLQGTLLLSRIITKQRENLSKNQQIQGLSHYIGDLRVQLFDMNEANDALNNTTLFITDLANSSHSQFSDEDNNRLKDIVLERRSLYSQIIEQLNSQLSIAINIELQQKQLTLLSTQLEHLLQQQSFWVQSNQPFNLRWLSEFPNLAYKQLQSIKSLINLQNINQTLPPILPLIFFMLLTAWLILWRKNRIKLRLVKISSEINTLSNDSQWHTPRAIFWTLVLALPGTFLFSSLLLLVVHIFFNNPHLLEMWILKMTGTWLFFAFILGLLRPKGVAYRHFNQPQNSLSQFRHLVKMFIPIMVLLVNSKILTKLADTGASHDVIGQLCLVVVFIVYLFVIYPNFNKAILHYRQEQKAFGNSIRYIKLVNFIRFLLILLPLLLIGLTVMGYYYTAQTLIGYIIWSYFASILWICLRDIVYRGVAVSFRRLTYRRREEERERSQQAISEVNAEGQLIDLSDLQLPVESINHQVTQVIDIILWLALGAVFYYIWSDLFTVVYYLEGVNLWQTNSSNGETINDFVSVFSVMSAVIILAVTYLLVRNIGGLLEVIFFSRMRMSQGLPYAITTIIIYGIIVVGTVMMFSTLGISWDKMQWLIAALSVGLGFGLQEIFANFVSGLIILFERPVRIGDLVTIGELSGTVSKIHIRATTLIDYDGKEVIVPNKTFVTERLVNWSLSNTITRIIISVGVAYGSDLKLTKKLMLQAADEAPQALKDPEPTVYFMGFGDSTLNHELRVYVEQIIDRFPMTDLINSRIDELFAEHNITIAFNQLDVYIKNTVSGEEIKLDSKSH